MDTVATSREVSAWLRKQGLTQRSDVMQKFGLTRRQLDQLEVPRYLIVLDEAENPPVFTEEQIGEALIRALRLTDRPYLSMREYTRLRRAGDMTVPGLLIRYGTWQATCDRFGIPVGHTPRASYTRNWDYESCLKVVRTYVRHAKRERVRPTYLGYEEWQRSRKAPSGTTVRKRCREAGLETWTSVVQEAEALTG